MWSNYLDLLLESIYPSSYILDGRKHKRVHQKLIKKKGLKQEKENNKKGIEISQK